MKYTYNTKQNLIACLISGLICISIPGQAQMQDSQLKTKQQFQEIATKLDLGGDLLLVANIDGIINQFIDRTIATDVGMPADSTEEQAIRKSVEQFRTFLNRNGFTAIHGIGLSSMQRLDGLYAIKCFISRDYIESNLPLWRGLTGWQPRRMLSLDFIPANAAFVRAGTPEPKALWTLIKSAMEDAAPETIRQHFEAWNKSMDKSLGFPFEDLVGSLRDEALLAVSFSESQEGVIPTKAGLVTIPEPSFLFIVGVKDDMLRGVIETSLAKHHIAIMESSAGDVTIRSATQPLPSLFRVQPAYASQAGFLIMGSSTEIVADALLAYRHKNGLLARPEFKSAFQNMSMVNNGLIYMSPEVGPIVDHIRLSAIEVLLDNASNHPASMRMLKQLFMFGGQPPSLAMTIHNWKTGVMVMGNSALGGRDMLQRFIATPARLLTQLISSIPPPEKEMVEPAKPED